MMVKCQGFSNFELNEFLICCKLIIKPLDGVLTLSKDHQIAYVIFSELIT